MRDPARIDRMLELVRRVWTRSPDLRLGQLLVNAVQPGQPCPDVFAMEDTVLARRLERMLRQHHRVEAGEQADTPAVQQAGRKAGKARFTHRQGQFLAFIHLYRKVHGQSPAELDLVKHFGVTPPSAHAMVVKLHRLGLLTREPGMARSIRVAVPEDEIPPLEDVPGPPR